MTSSRVPPWLWAPVAGVAGAAAAGMLPNVLTGWFGDGRVVATVVCLVAAGAFALVNWLQQRRKGVGVVVVLPLSSWREPWSRQWLRAADSHARRHHDSCLSVERPVDSVRVGDPPEVKASKRERRRQALDVAVELVGARLSEVATSDPSMPVSLYVNAALPEAFELGAALKRNVHRRLRVLEPLGSDSSSPDEGWGPWVQQRSEQEDADFYPAVRISGRLKDSPSEAEQARLADVLAPPVVHELGGGPEATAIALVVHLAHNAAMVEEALHAAAAGCADSEGRWVRCRTAVVFEGVQPNLPEDGEVFELAVRQVYTEWSAHASGTGARRLFLAAPVSVGFALGWLLGASPATAVVPFPYDTTPPDAARRSRDVSPIVVDGRRVFRVAGMPKTDARRVGRRGASDRIR